MLIVSCAMVHNLYTMNTDEFKINNATLKVKDRETDLAQQMLQNSTTEKTTGFLSYQDPIWYHKLSIAYILTKPFTINNSIYQALQFKGKMGIAKDHIVRFEGELSYMRWAGACIKNPDTYFSILIDPINSKKNKLIEAPARPLITNEEIESIHKQISK
jgi:hypothetical protein